jgi:hypothetical protein
MTVLATSGPPASAAAGKKPNVSAIKAGKIAALVFTRISLNVLFGITAFSSVLESPPLASRSKDE